MKSRTLGFVCTLAVVSTLCCAAETNTLDKHLEPLRPLLGKTFRAEFKAPDSGSTVTDVLRWERTLNGKAVRTLHSVNEGAYGGETIYVWDTQEQVLKFFYFTTAGFHTTGTVQFKDGKILTHEVVRGFAGNIKEVKGVSELKPDGSFVVGVQHLTQKGEWVPAPERVYKPDPAASVRFK